MIRFALTACLALAFLPLSAPGASRHNRDAQSLARQLAPIAPATKADSGAVAELGKRMAGILQALERSYRTSGPAPESLLAKAFDFREDVGPWEELMLSNSILSAWREANALGLFDENGNFQATVSRGRGVGDRMLFELIVPAAAYPPASNQLANLRLVREAERRDSDEGTGPRELAYLSQLRKLVDERADFAAAAKRARRKVNDLGRTEEEERRLWDERMAEAGEAAKRPPRVQVSGNLEATPAHMTGQRWRVGCEVRNFSSHPTGVTVTTWLIGCTDKKRDHYVMAKDERFVRLVPGQVTGYDVYTRAEGAYKKAADDHDGLSKAERSRSRVRYRGYVIRVSHETGPITFAGSDQTLAAYADPDGLETRVEALPAF